MNLARYHVRVNALTLLPRQFCCLLRLLHTSKFRTLISLALMRPNTGRNSYSRVQCTKFACCIFCCIYSKYLRNAFVVRLWDFRPLNNKYQKVPKSTTNARGALQFLNRPTSRVGTKAARDRRCHQRSARVVSERQDAAERTNPAASDQQRVSIALACLRSAHRFEALQARDLLRALLFSPQVSSLVSE